VSPRRDHSQAAVADGDRLGVRSSACRLRAPASSAWTALPVARLPLPAVLRPRLGDRLPLHVRHGVGFATCERHDVVSPISGHEPPGSPVDGQGCSRSNSLATSCERCSFAEARHGNTSMSRPTGRDGLDSRPLVNAPTFRT
jgi:hypothetical protein